MSNKVRIVYEGQLEKQGMFGWKKYHCVLDGFSFSMTPQGSRLSMSNTLSIHTNEIQQVRGVQTKSGSKHFLMEIIKKTDDKGLMLASSSEQERKRWLAKFNNVLSAYKELSSIKTLGSQCSPHEKPAALPVPHASDERATYAYVEVRERTVSSYEANSQTGFEYAEVVNEAKEDIKKELQYMEAAEEKKGNVGEASKPKTVEEPKSPKKHSAPKPPNNPPPPPPTSPCPPPPLELYATVEETESEKKTETKNTVKQVDSTDKKSPNPVLAGKPGIAPKPRHLSSSTQSSPRSTTSSTSSSSSPRSPNTPKSQSPRSPVTHKSPPKSLAVPTSHSPRSPTAPTSQGPRSPTAPTSQGPRSPTAPVSQGPRSPTVPANQGPRSPTAPTSQGPRSPTAPVSQGPRSPTVPVSQGPRSPTAPANQGPRSLSSKNHHSPSAPKSPQSPTAPKIASMSSPIQNGLSSPSTPPTPTEAKNGDVDPYAGIRRNSAVNRRQSSSSESEPKSTLSQSPPVITESKQEDDDHDDQRAEELVKAMNKSFPPIPAIPYSSETVDNSSVETLRDMLVTSTRRPLSMKLGKGGEGVTQMKLQLRQISEIVEEEDDDVFNTAL